MKKTKESKGSFSKNLIYINCPICESKTSLPYDSERGYNLVKCSNPNCGALYVNPRPCLESITMAAQTGEHSASGGKIRVTGTYKRSRVKRFLMVLNDFYPERVGRHTIF